MADDPQVGTIVPLAEDDECRTWPQGPQAPEAGP